MKYAKAILVTIVVGVLLDILIDAIIPDHVMNVVFIVVASIVLLGVLLVGVGTVRKNSWGINLEPVICPACGSPMPKVRQPKSRRQGLWGGWTCAKCGCEIDKWGRPDYASTIAVESTWERFGKELSTSKSPLIRTESTGRVFDYVLITRRSSVQI